MTIRETERYMIDLAASYFGDGHVFYVWHKMTRRPVPYLTVKFGGYSKGEGKITLYDEKDRCYKDYRQMRTAVELNLYTAGEDVAGIGQASAYENTALEDMSEFVKYLDSEAVRDDMALHNLAIDTGGEVHDLSFLLNDSTYRYRAMMELAITYTDCAYGKFGQNGLNLPNSSNGGNEEMIVPNDTIENVEIREEEDGKCE